LGGALWSLGESVDKARTINTIHAAIDAGVTLIDTAHVYTTRDEEAHNERLIAEALACHPNGYSVHVATKGGHFRAGDEFPIDGRPETIRHHCESSLRALGVECIWLYQLHMPDPSVPLADSVAALAQLRSEGKIALAGLSNVSVSQLEEALRIVDIASVQNAFSPGMRERGVLEFSSSHGIAYLAYEPLGGPGEARKLEKAFPPFAAVASARGVSVQQVVLAWELAQSAALIPIVGSSRPETAVDSAAVLQLELTPEELNSLDG
jgi:aryl-alcohol dehydrogenase-like predicted oxidoreductase